MSARGLTPERAALLNKIIGVLLASEEPMKAGAIAQMIGRDRASISALLSQYSKLFLRFNKGKGWGLRTQEKTNCDCCD